MQSATHGSVRSNRRPRRGGWTLIELLVAIGILVVLVSLLIPAISKARIAARVADTQNMVNRLSSAIQRYSTDYNGAFPGPLSNDLIIYGGTNPNNPADMLPAVYSSGQPSGSLQNVQMSENLVLGLLGGLVWETQSGTPAWGFEINSAYYGLGPTNLNQRGGAYNPTRTSAYLEVRRDELTAPDGNGNGQFIDSGGTPANDSIIPEFLDKFGGDSMPILYYRARQGAVGIMSKMGVDETNSSISPANYQYDIAQNTGYTAGNCGILQKSLYTTHGFDRPGLVDPTQPDGMILDRYSDDPDTLGNPSPRIPYLPFFRQTADSTNDNVGSTPRKKDGFILIAAGPKRIYGAPDNITNLGNLGGFGQ